MEVLLPQLTFPSDALLRTISVFCTTLFLTLPISTSCLLQFIQQTKLNTDESNVVTEIV